MIADIITFSRIIFSLLLLVFSPQSFIFTVLYLLCGATDILDGFIARKLHTESEKGAMLDSVADLVFAVVYAVTILPCMKVPAWIWIWTAIIAVIKVFVIILVSKKKQKLFVQHSFLNKLTGILIFLLPLSMFVADVKYGATIVCIAATASVINDIYTMKGKRKMSKYEPLWKWIEENGTENFRLSFSEIEKILGFAIDHSFLSYKKELSEYGFNVGRISMKEQTVCFEKCSDKNL